MPFGKVKALLAGVSCVKLTTRLVDGDWELEMGVILDTADGIDRYKVDASVLPV